VDFIFPALGDSKVEVPGGSIPFVRGNLEAVVAGEVLHRFRDVIKHLGREANLNALKVRRHLKVNHELPTVFKFQIVEVLGDRDVVDVVDCADGGS